MSLSLRRVSRAWWLLILPLLALTMVPMVFAGAITVDNTVACVTGSQPDPYTVTYCSIQDAIDDAASGDTITIADSTYAEVLSLTTDNLTLQGTTEAGTIIDATAATNYHFFISANDVTVRNFTLNGNPAASYGLKIEGSASDAPIGSGVPYSNVIVEHVTVNSTKRTGIDVNGINNLAITDVEVNNVPSGNGVALTDVNNATLNTIDTNNNAWGGIAIYTYGRYFPGGSNNVQVTNATSTGEDDPLYHQVGNYGDPGNPFPITNFGAPQYLFAIRNNTFREPDHPDSPDFILFQKTEAGAIARALGVSTPDDSIVNRYIAGSLGNFIVGNDGVNSMKIQTAHDRASAGATIELRDGTYAEIVDINKGITLDGASESGTIIDASAATSYHFTVDADNVTLKDFTLQGAGGGSYGLKVSGLDAATKHTNFVLSNVSIHDTYRTALDLNGIDGATISNVTATGVIYGNGASLTDTDNATLDNITTSGNAWGGLAIYTLGNYYPGGSDNVTVTNLNAAEDNKLYHEVGGGFAITNFSAPQFPFTLRNVVELPNHTFFNLTETDAIAGAVAVYPTGWVTPTNSFVNRISDGNFIVGNDGVSSMSVQAAVDNAAASGDTIEVRDGTYEGVVTVDGKALTIIGDSTNAIILSPTTVPLCYTSSAANYAFVCLKNGADATLDTLTIDGGGRGNSNYRFQGVGISNSSATVQNSVVTGVRDTPFSGAQHGVAIGSWNNDTVPQTINILNTTIEDFQKNALALSADASTPLTINVDGNTINGAGATGVTAQNGVQAFGALISGDVTNNTINGIGYSGGTWVATSILNFYADLNVSGNTINAGHMGVYYYEGAGTIAGNIFNIEKIGPFGYGIIATDPPSAVPSPFDNGTETSAPAGNGTDAVVNVTIDGNALSFSGLDNSDTIGVYADSGYGPNDVQLVAVNNIVNGFDLGMGWFECTSGCTGTVFTSIVANFNCMESNNTGMESAVSYLTVDAENNWWGDASGPANAANPGGLGNPVVGDVDFDPWEASCTAGGNLWQNSTTEAYYASLQDALDAAAPGDVIAPVGAGPHEGGATATTPDVTIDLSGGTGGPGSSFLTVAAANVSVIGPGTLDGAGDPNPAIEVVAGGDNFRLENVEVTGWSDGVYVGAPVTSFKLASNYIHDNSGSGLYIDSGATLGGVVTVEGNLFKANGAGVTNLNGAALDATYNSWGCYTGPGTATCDTVSSDVTFTPFTFSEMYVDVDPPNDPGTVNRLEGETFDVHIAMDAWNITSIEFDVTYDDTMLTLNSVTFPDSDFGTCADISAAPNELHYFCYNLLLPAPGYSGIDKTIAVLNFTAEDNGGLVDPGPWSAIFDLDVATTTSSSVGGAKVFVNNAGFGAPETRALIDDANDGEIVIAGTAQFAGFIDLEGRTNDSGATVTVYDVDNILAALALAEGTSTSAGAFTTAGIGSALLAQGDTFWLYVDAPLYLPTTADADSVFAHSAVLTDRPTTALNLLVLRGGDATDDNAISILDATCIGTDFGSSTSTCSTGDSDVNADGIINILDLALMGGNWTSTFSAWTPQ